MMKQEKTALIEKEGKKEFINMLMSVSMTNQIIYNILSHYTYSYSPQNCLIDILNEHYEEILQVVIKTLLMENKELQNRIDEYIKTSVSPIIGKNYYMGLDLSTLKDMKSVTNR